MTHKEPQTRQKVITMTLFNRPEYTRQVLEALKKCDGVDKYLILPSVEPGNDEVIDLVRGVKFADCLPQFNSRRLGLEPNILSALDRGFEAADFVVHLEDDTEPAPDFLLYMEHCRQAYRMDPEVFSVSGYNRVCDPSPLRISRRKWFTCWGWGTWIDRWLDIRDQWPKYEWDLVIGRELRGDRHEIFPAISRIQNIGADSGVHSSPEFHKKYLHVERWAGNMRIPRGGFWEEKCHSPRS